MGKWYLHRFYSGASEIREYLPPTAIFSARTLAEFMGSYDAVYIKPDREHQGKGIVKAWKRRSGGYASVRIRGEAVRCGTIDELYRGIMNRSLPQPYVIQKAVPLASIHGRPFDIRVMMMRNRRGRWQYFGLYSKVAGPKSIVTNISTSRGYVTTFEKSMNKSLGMNRTEVREVKRKLVQLSHAICERAGRIRYYQKVGIDYAVDRKGRIWLIEVNFTYPGYKGFSRLPNLKYYRRIKRMDAFLRARRLRRG